jgi:outer membrane receptor protein involved in Fe transport
MRSFKKNNLPAWIAICSYGATLALSSSVASAASNMLEEVIVEAQKKSETITETPIAIQAITGEQFQKYASFNLQDLSRTTAGLNFDTGVSIDIRLRGTSTVANAPVSLRTNIYVDGALIEQPRSIFDAQYDIAGFEVLKGPQGTLYGKSSPTGTINIRTKNPNLTAMEGYVQGSVGNLDTRNTQFAVSIPLIEGVLGVRFAGVYDENKTGQKDVTTGSEAQNRNSGGRITVLWEPTDEFSARASYNYREKHSNPWYTINGAGYRYYDDKITANKPDVDKSRDQLAILELNYSFLDHYTLTSVTAYEDQEYSNFQDTDGTSSVIAAPSINQLVGGDTQLTRIPLRPQWQQDLRLASEDNDFWDWLIGGYYHRSTSTVNVDVLKYSNGSVNVNTKLVGINEEFAGYMHNTFKLTDQLNLIAGVRYQSFRQKTSQPTTGFLVGNEPPYPQQLDLVANGLLNGEGIPADQQKTYAHPWTGTLKLQYSFNPDLAGYASIDRAYRVGAANLNLQGNLPVDFATVKPESSNSIEVGLKGNFWDRRGRFSTAIFDQVYKGFQQDIQNVTVLQPNGVGGNTSNANSLAVNAKEAEIRGIEAEVSLLLVEGWDVTVSATYNDAKFNDFKNNPCTGDVSQINAAHPYNTCDLSGERLPLAPKYAGVVTSNFSMPAFAGTDWYFNTLFNVRSDQIDKVTRSTLGGYATWDFFTGLRASEKDSWDVSLWLKNAFDRRVVTRIFNSTDFNPPLQQLTGQNFEMVTTNAPRQFGVTGTYRF